MKKLIQYSLIIFTFVLGPSCSLKASDVRESVKLKAILVTGASSGIGRNIAVTLAKNGYFVYAGARKQKDLDELNAIENIQSIKLDVTIQSEIDSAVETVKTEGRGLYGLVNNAGVALFEPLIEVSEEDLQFQMDVNVMGPYRVTKAFAPLVIKEKGRITTIGSVAGLASGAMFGPYSMSKFSMEAYTEALAQEMRKFGVQVSIIEPGNYNSNVMSNLKSRAKKEEKDRHKTLYGEEYRKLAGFTNEDRSRFKEPDEVSDAVIKALFDRTAALRYMVVPTEQEAAFPLKRVIAKVVQLNQQHAFRFKRETLIEWLDLELSKQKKLQQKETHHTTAERASK